LRLFALVWSKRAEEEKTREREEEERKETPIRIFRVKNPILKKRMGSVLSSFFKREFSRRPKRFVRPPKKEKRREEKRREEREREMHTQTDKRRRAQKKRSKTKKRSNNQTVYGTEDISSVFN